jgi:hypothetical protein
MENNSIKPNPIYSLNNGVTLLNVSWLRRCATRRKNAGSSPNEVDFFFNLLNPSGRTLALESTLTEMSSRNLPGCKVRPARRADNLTAICEPII